MYHLPHTSFSDNFAVLLIVYSVKVCSHHLKDWYLVFGVCATLALLVGLLLRHKHYYSNSPIQVARKRLDGQKFFNPPPTPW